MPTEIEAKMRVADHQTVGRRLEESGAEATGEVIERDAFFDTADRALMGSDRGMRLRVQRSVDDAAREPRIRLTYKGPRTDSRVKTRRELETDIGDAETFASVLEELGFERTIEFEKRRQHWQLSGCCVTLDTLPHLGCFVEIEGPDEPTVLAVREQLHLGGAALITDSYAKLLAGYLEAHGIADRVITL